VAISAVRTYIVRMNEKDVVDKLGPPDEIVDRSQRMRRHKWACSTCRELMISPEPIPFPAQCRRCGGIFFEAVKVDRE